MWKKLLNNESSTLEERLVAIEAEMTGEGSLRFQVVRFTRKKNTIDFRTDTAAYTDTESLLAALKKDKVLLLIFTGRGVVTKTFAPEPENGKIALTRVIPNASEEEFFVQQVHSATQAFVTVTRRKTWEELLHELTGKGFILADVWLGPVCAAGIKALLPGTALNLPRHLLQFDAQGLCALQAREESPVADLLIDGKKVQAASLTALGGGFGYYAPTLEHTPIDSELLTLSQKELRQKQLFRKAGAGLLAVFMLILLGNYFAFSHYSERYKLLEEQLSVHTSELEMLNQLKKELAEKRSMVERSGIFNHMKLSFFADRLAMQVPSSIRLTDMQINPLQGRKLKANEKATFGLGTILLAGKVSRSTDLNEWIHTIKAQEWTKEVTVLNYSQAIGEHTASFELDVKVN